MTWLALQHHRIRGHCRTVSSASTSQPGLPPPRLCGTQWSSILGCTTRLNQHPHRWMTLRPSLSQVRPAGAPASTPTRTSPRSRRSSVPRKLIHMYPHTWQVRPHHYTQQQRGPRITPAAYLRGHHRPATPTTFLSCGTMPRW